MVLLIQALFSATDHIHAGGKAASDPVEVITHMYKRVQLQMIGYDDLLTPYMTAVIFQGIATAGATLGYFYCTLTIHEDGVGKVARVDIR